MSHPNLERFIHYGYAGLFFGLMLEIIALPIPGETMLTFAGYLIFKGKMSLLPAFLSGLAGSVVGITISYGLGRTLGYRLLHRHGARFGLTEEKLRLAHDWFERIGKWTLTFGYFLPGVRHLAGLVAGASELEPHVFGAFAYPGCVLWVASFLALGYYLGDEWAKVSARMHYRLEVGTLIVLAVLAAYGAIIFIQHRRHRHP